MSNYRALEPFEVESSSKVNRQRYRFICSALMFILFMVFCLLLSRMLDYWLLYQMSQKPILTELEHLNITQYRIQFEKTLAHINQTLNQTDQLITDIKHYIPSRH
jgi:hypothetical protein